MYNFFMVFLIGFISWALPAHAANQAAIVVTLPPLAGIVNLLDNSLDVQCLLSAGADPHHTSLRPRQMEQIKSSSLLIRAGIDDAGWKIPILSSQTKTLTLWSEHDHAWLLPAQVQKILPILAEKITQLYPQHANIIAENLQLLQKEDGILQKTAIKWQNLFQQQSSSGVILQHGAWQHLFATYGLPVLMVLDATHGHDARPRHLEKALRLGKQHPDAWLIASANSSTRVMDSLAKRLGRNYYRLNALGSCEQSWSELMLNNMQILQNTPKQSH
ncbi:MAG: zinc ABC transporter substrate-binding protein [Mariprofundales bacterium]